MSNNEHWNTVDWSQIPEDVEAVLTFPDQPYHLDRPLSYFKTINGVLMSEKYRGLGYWRCSFQDMGVLAREVVDRLHLRPEPLKPNQVKSYQMKDTGVTKFDWSTVDDDVEAVFLFMNSDLLPQYYKVVGGLLMVRFGISGSFERSSVNSLRERVEGAERLGTTYYVRPPATPPLDKVGGEIQVEYVTLEKPSIQSILSDAQELIKKHHNITGEVKFTIKCS